MPATYYALLGVPPHATVGQIRRAFHRLRRQFPPEPVGDAGLDRFRLVQQAYDALADHARRADYDRALRQAGLTASDAELVQPSAPTPQLPSFDLATGIERDQEHRDRLLDRIRQNPLARQQAKSQVAQEVAVQVILSPHEAAAGGHLPIDVPVAHICTRCDGTGSTGFMTCDQCDGHGVWWRPHRVDVIIPSHVRDQTSIPVSLAHLGIRNLYLAIHVRVTASTDLPA